MVRASLAVTCGAILVTAACVVAAAPAAAITHYTLDPAKSSLEFAFTQAGALNKGHFGRFPVTLDFSADNLTASPGKIGQIARATLVLTLFEHKMLT